MSTIREQYRIAIHPKASPEGPAKMSRYIINRWMPGNAGGILVFGVPQLVGLLSPLFEKSRASGKDITIQINTLGITPVLTEIP